MADLAKHGFDRQWGENLLPDNSYLWRGVASLVLLLTALAAMPVQAQSSAEWPLTNFDKRSVELSDIMSGGPPRDGIPPIDMPEFISASEAEEWLGDTEPVILFSHNNDVRIYPLQIMTYHEIVNDTVGDLAVAVTFCPLCNASIVFDSAVDGKVLDFGTTGKLRLSDLVMYDRQTESWWQQFTGTAIIGDYTDTVLTQLPSQIVSFAAARDTFPSIKVLSRNTGYQRPYGNNPYAGYDSINSSPFLYRGKIDPRLAPMERVLSVPHDGGITLIPFEVVEKNPIIELAHDEKPVVVIALDKANSALDQGNIVDSRLVASAAAFSAVASDQTLTFRLVDGIVEDVETGSIWNAFGQAMSGELKGTQLQQVDQGVHFAFAWLAFDPDATVFEP